MLLVCSFLKLTLVSWLTLKANTVSHEQHVQVWAPPPHPIPHPPEKWQAHLKPVSESSLATDWQETLARSHKLPAETFLLEEMPAPPTQAHATSAEDSLLRRWADSNRNHLTEDLQHPRRTLAPGLFRKTKTYFQCVTISARLRNKHCLGKKHWEGIFEV